MESFSLGLWDLLLLPVALPLRAAWTGLEQAVRQAEHRARPRAALLGELADRQADLTFDGEQGRPAREREPW